MDCLYPNLIGEIARRGIKKRVIATTVGIENRTLYNKLAGKTDFSYDEAHKIQSVFFPDMSVDTLFLRKDQQPQSS